MPQGSQSIGDGELVGAGIRQLEYLDQYYNELANSRNEEESDKGDDIKEQYKEEALGESEEMAENIQGAVDELGISNQVEIDFDEEYVMLNLSGAILFDSGKAEILS